MSRPTSCRACMAEFERRPLLMAEASHLARTVSEGTGRSLVDEELDEYHANGHDSMFGHDEGKLV